MIQEKLLKQYVELEEEFKLLSDKKAELREAILIDLKKNKVEKVESDYGKFTVAHKTSWSYSPKVTGMEEKLKLARIKEQEKGIAKPEVSDHLVFTKPKAE